MGKSFKRSRFEDDDYSKKSDKFRARRSQKKKKREERFDEDRRSDLEYDGYISNYDLEN